MSLARLEREARFALPDPAALAAVAVRLQELGVQLGRARSSTYEDVYLDTRDVRLWRAGVGLRVRRESRRIMATLKTGRVHSNVADRWEWSESLGRWRESTTPAPVPGRALRRKLREASLPVRVRPIAKLSVRRTVWSARWPEGWTAKVCADHVQAQVGRRRVEFAELEIEGAWDDNRLLQAIRAIRACSSWSPVRASKLERALALAGRPLPMPPPKCPENLPADLTPAEAAQRFFSTYWALYTWNLPGAMAGFDPEFLHDLRVAIRRLRATASALEAALPPSATRWVRELRPTARIAGTVRDLDIVRAWMIEPDVRALAVPSSARRWLASVFARERTRRIRNLRQWLRGRAHIRLCRTVPRRLHSITDGAHTSALEVIRERVEEARTAARLIARDLHEDSPLERFHELRIRCKWLRYRLELLRHFGLERTRKAIAELASLQNALGRLQDLATVRAELIRLPTRGMPSSAHRLLDAWSALLARQIEATRQTAWTQVQTLKWRRLRP